MITSYTEYTITVNTKDEEHYYTMKERTADLAIAKVKIFHPDWTSMVVVFSNT